MTGYDVALVPADAVPPLPGVPPGATAAQWLRFVGKVVAAPAQGCHWWVGALGDDGYGRWYAQPGQVVRAHRWLWEAWHGPLPADRVVMHQVCDEPSCVRLDHLQAGSQTENLAVMARRARDGNRWRGGRGGDRRGMAARSRAIRAALQHGYDAGRLAAALADGDRLRDQLCLFADAELVLSPG